MRPPHLRDADLITVQSVAAVTKDIFVWIMLPRRSVNYFNCAGLEIILLTYLLT